MRKFPGEIELEKTNGTRKYVLTDEQEKWLKKWFPVTEIKRIAKAMGCGVTTVYTFVRQLGLKRSEAGLKAIRKRRDKAAARTNERNGCYDRKRGHPVSEATMAGNRRRFEEERLGLRENPQLRIKREEPEKYKEWIRKRSDERREAIRKEKLRIMYGLERQTNLKPVVLVPYKKSQIHHRSVALKKGYILTEDCSEGNPDRYVIYFDELTERSERFEKNCLLDGFKIQQWT